MALIRDTNRQSEENICVLSQRQEESLRSLYQLGVEARALAEAKPGLPCSSQPSPVPNSRPIPTSRLFPVSADEPEVTKRLPKNATRDLTLRLTERDYADLLERTAECGFPNLQVYFNYLHSVGEEVMANREVGVSPFGSTGDGKGHLSFDDFIVWAVTEEQRFNS